MHKKSLFRSFVCFFRQNQNHSDKKQTICRGNEIAVWNCWKTVTIKHGKKLRRLVKLITRGTRELDYFLNVWRSKTMSRMTNVSASTRSSRARFSLKIRATAEFESAPFERPAHNWSTLLLMLATSLVEPSSKSSPWSKRMNEALESKRANFNVSLFIVYKYVI